MRLYTPYSLSRGAPSATRSRFQVDALSHELGLSPGLIGFDTHLDDDFAEAAVIGLVGTTEIPRLAARRHRCR